MRKATILLTVLFAVAATTAAEAAKKKAAPAAKPDPAVAATQQSASFVRDSMMPWTTSLAKPADTKAKGKKKKKS
jgi:hypothetical protein